MSIEKINTNILTEEKNKFVKEKENLVFSNAISAQGSPSFVEIKVESTENKDEFITYWFPVSDIQEVKIVTKIVDTRR